MNAPQSEHEPKRFGMTGNRWLSDFQLEFCGDEMSGPLDAPSYIARGSVRGSVLPATAYSDAAPYINHTECRG